LEKAGRAKLVGFTDDQSSLVGEKIEVRQREFRTARMCLFEHAELADSFALSSFYASFYDMISMVSNDLRLNLTRMSNAGCQIAELFLGW
jgi:hypothetical protein